MPFWPVVKVAPFVGRFCNLMIVPPVASSVTSLPCPLPVPLLAPNAVAKLKLLLRRQKVPLFRFVTVGKSPIGAGVIDLPSPSSSYTVSPFIAAGLDGTPSLLSSDSRPNDIPNELFLRQKLPLLFLFRLCRGLDITESAPGVVGLVSDSIGSGAVRLDDRRNALKESKLRTLLGRFGLFLISEDTVVVVDGEV